MQKIKVALKVFNSKSPVEKLLVRIVNETTPDLSHDKQLKPLIQSFLHSNTEEEGENAYAAFNTCLRNCKGWMPAFKMLYVAHQLIDNVGKKFCVSFLSEYFENIHDLMKNKNDIEDYVHAVLAANYYNFLVTYAKYLPDIQVHLSKDPSELLKATQQGSYVNLVQLVTFKNIIKYFTKVEECIEGSANVLKERGLINKISHLLIRDVTIIYNLISASLSHTMHAIFDLDPHMALLLDELYSDMLQITKKLPKLIEKAQRNGVSYIEEPHYFVLDSEFNRAEELYILELKKLHPKNQNQGKQLPYQGYMQQYQTLNPGKRLYKLNTGVTQFTKVPDSARKAFENYYNLASPELSHIEDDSVSPMKNHEENGYYNSHQNALGFGERPSSPYKDMSAPMKLEIQMPKNNRFLTLDEDNFPREDRGDLLKYGQDFTYKKSPESVIFSPTSNQTPKDFEDNRFESSPESLSNNKFKFEDIEARKKRLNLNLANF